jgi:hypothetical protein
MERLTRFGAGERSGMIGEGVRNDVETLGGYPEGAELVGLELRNGDHCVESTERESLELFVRSVLQATTGKTVYGGYYRHTGLTSGMATYEIRSVTMCMHYVYAAAIAESADERALLKIAASWHDQRHQLDVCLLEQGREIPAISRR